MNNIHPVMAAALAPFAPPRRQPEFKFSNTFCSACGRAFGSGNYGYSDCDAHANVPEVKEQPATVKELFGIICNPVYIKSSK